MTGVPAMVFSPPLPSALPERWSLGAGRGAVPTGSVVVLSVRHTLALAERAGSSWAAAHVPNAPLVVVLDPRADSVELLAALVRRCSRGSSPILMRSPVDGAALMRVTSAADRFTDQFRPWLTAAVPRAGSVGPLLGRSPWRPRQARRSPASSRASGSPRRVRGPSWRNWGCRPRARGFDSAKRCAIAFRCRLTRAAPKRFSPEGSGIPDLRCRLTCYDGSSG